MATPLMSHQNLRLSCVGLQAMISFHSRVPFILLLHNRFYSGTSQDFQGKAVPLPQTLQLTDEGRLEECLGAAEALIANGDDLAIG